MRMVRASCACRRRHARRASRAIESGPASSPELFILVERVFTEDLAERVFTQDLAERVFTGDLAERVRLVCVVVEVSQIILVDL